MSTKNQKTKLSNKEKMKTTVKDTNIQDNYNSVEIHNPALDNISNKRRSELENKRNNAIEELRVLRKGAENDGQDTTGYDSKIEKLQQEGNKGLNRDELLKSMKNDTRGVKIYVHSKPYADYAWPWETSRKQNYISNVNYEIIGRDNPYARVDENLRQLKLYTINDAKPYYITNENNETDRIESVVNNDKMGPERYFQYVSKDILLQPNNKQQKGAASVDKAVTSGGKLRRTKNRKRISKKRKRKTKKTKRNKKN
jgi:hypothetical protein